MAQFSAESQAPGLTQLANYRNSTRMQKVRVLNAGWVGAGGKAVTLGEEIALHLDDAQLARSLGRVEFV